MSIQRISIWRQGFGGKPNAARGRFFRSLAMLLPLALIEGSSGLFHTRESFAATPVSAQTITAVSCLETEVQNAVNSALDGSTVVIPSGTCQWSSAVSITKGITLQGQGVGSTVIQYGASGSAILSINTATGHDWRITGIRFTGGSGSGFTGGIIAPSGSSHAFRIDHIQIDGLPSQVHGIEFHGDLWGVVDHSTFIAPNGNEMIRAFHDSWQGVGGKGANSWAQPTNPGSQQAIYVEDSTFTMTPGGPNSNIIDAYSGSRLVVRHNTFTTSNIETHGTETACEFRSVRWLEVYNNTFNGKGLDNWYVDYRGGSGVVFSNTVNPGNNPSFMVRTTNYRDTENFSCNAFGQCSGSSAWDQNVGGGGHGAGYACMDQPGRGQGLFVTESQFSPVLQSTGRPGWPQQGLEPIYVWGNSLQSGMVALQTAGATHSGGTSFNVVAGVDAFGDGTQKPGYTPYVYPHPLQNQNTSSRPSPPTGLTVIVH